MKWLAYVVTWCIPPVGAFLLLTAYTYSVQHQFNILLLNRKLKRKNVTSLFGNNFLYPRNSIHQRASPHEEVAYSSRNSAVFILVKRLKRFDI